MKIDLTLGSFSISVAISVTLFVIKDKVNTFLWWRKCYTFFILFIVSVSHTSDIIEYASEEVVVHHKGHFAVTSVDLKLQKPKVHI